MPSLFQQTHFIRMLEYKAPFQYPIRHLIVRYREVLKSRDGSLNCRIALKFDMHTGSDAAEEPAIFHSDQTILNINLADARLHEVIK